MHVVAPSPTGRLLLFGPRGPLLLAHGRNSSF